MDPNAVLNEARACLKDGDYASGMALFNMLDEWLSKGGFLPTDWSKSNGQG